MSKTISFLMIVVLSCFQAGVVLSQPVDRDAFQSRQNPLLPPSSLSGNSSKNLVDEELNQAEAMVPHDPQSVTPAFDADGISRDVADGIIGISDPRTAVAPSHFGHPGYESAAFLYDKAVDALVLNAAGRKAEAEALLDYFADKLRIPFSEVKRYADSNGVYGMLKLYPSVDAPRAVGLVNAFNLRSTDREGQGQLEYWSTPGPLAFIAMAFLNVDRKKYLKVAETVGEAILAMQREDGAIIDGDRSAVNVHTEPHMDSYSTLLMLYDVTGNKKWKTAADKAWTWFERNVYHPEESQIYQGMRGELPSQVFATDAYSWTMAGRGGDRLSPDVLMHLTDRMLRQSVTRVTLEVPDGTMRTVTLVDFADIKDMRITADRGGFHPMGSVEWIGGVILALQKNAVRFWEAGDPEWRTQAKFYKGLAEYFQAQALNAFYKIDGVNGIISFYATGQWVATGHGWRTPYFYVKDPNGTPVIKGGSTIGGWPVLPLQCANPFQLDDNYGAIYNAIPVDGPAQAHVQEYVETLVQERMFAEIVPHEIVEGADEIPELWRYNQKMFLSFNAGDYYAAILWAQKVINNADWMQLAKNEQKRKAREVGGLVEYMWGMPTENARDQQKAIQRYPVLNEMGAAMWGMAVSHFKLGNRAEAKQWIRTVIEVVPYHQIYAPNGPGYWNALISWETNPGGTALDAQMGEIYREVLAEMGKASALPNVMATR